MRRSASGYVINGLRPCTPMLLVQQAKNKQSLELVERVLETREGELFSNAYNIILQRRQCWTGGTFFLKSSEFHLGFLGLDLQSCGTGTELAEH